MTTNKKKAKKTASTLFIKPPEVDTLLAHLQKKLGVTENADGSYQLDVNYIISDVQDNEGRQYVDLVQKGGGVWGIALVGFTYVMEGLGIRFLRLAGTSAGAINTALLAAIGEKEEKKSEQILKLLANTDIYEFVDGHQIVRLFIDFMARKKKKKNLWPIIKTGYSIILTLGILLLLTPFAHLNIWGLTVFYLTSLLIIIPFIIFAFGVLLYRRMGQAGLGINPGENFLIWLRRVLETNLQDENISDNTSEDSENSLNTTKLLMKKVERCPELKLVHNEYRGVGDLIGDITIITADLVTKNKVELPKMRILFQTSNPENGYHPFNDAAEMVRASMAIPLFFESFYARNINKNKTDSFWQEYFKSSPPSECRFVDGGIMSNFPINIYLNPDIEEPRLPTIGINLIEEESKGKKAVDINSNQWNLFKYFTNLFNASRHYYDKDFILKNELVSDCIADVPIRGIHWLEFGMDAYKKADLFMQGAKAAYLFFYGEEWSTEITKEKSVKENANEETRSKTTDKGQIEEVFRGFKWSTYKQKRMTVVKDITIVSDQNSK